MKIRLEKEGPQAVPLSEIPVGHVGRSTRHSGARVFRGDSQGMVLDGPASGSSRAVECFSDPYIDEGPLQPPQPTRRLVEFAKIPIGHAARTSSGEVFLRTDGGGVFLGLNEGAAKYRHGEGMPIAFFCGMYEDLGKLVIEDD